MLFSDDDCITVGGADAGKQCIFPFKYKGLIHNECTTASYSYAWCSTKIDSNGDFVSGAWGHCGSRCLTKTEGTSNQSRNKREIL